MAATATEGIGEFLKRLKLAEKYSRLFQENGYYTVDDCAGFDGEKLQELGISLPGHRRRIINNLPRRSTSPRFAEPSTETREESTYDFLPKRSSSNSTYSQQPTITQDSLYDELPKFKVDMAYTPRRNMKDDSFRDPSYWQHPTILGMPPFEEHSESMQDMHFQQFPEPPEEQFPEPPEEQFPEPPDEQFPEPPKTFIGEQPYMLGDAPREQRRMVQEDSIYEEQLMPQLDTQSRQSSEGNKEGLIFEQEYDCGDEIYNYPTPISESQYDRLHTSDRNSPVRHQQAETGDNSAYKQHFPVNQYPLYEQDASENQEDYYEVPPKLKQDLYFPPPPRELEDAISMQHLNDNDNEDSTYEPQPSQRNYNSSVEQLYNHLDRNQTKSQDDKDRAYNLPRSNPTPFPGTGYSDGSTYEAVSRYETESSEQQSADTLPDYSYSEDVRLHALRITNKQDNDNVSLLEFLNEENEYEETHSLEDRRSRLPQYSTANEIGSDYPANNGHFTDQTPRPKTGDAMGSSNFFSGIADRIGRARSGGVSMREPSLNSKEKVDSGPRQRMRKILRGKGMKTKERPVSVCMQDNLTVASENRVRTHSSTLNRDDYSSIRSLKGPEMNSDVQNKYFMKASTEQQPMIPVSPLKKTRTKSGWLWRQTDGRDSKVTARKHWAVFDGEELVYYDSDSKMEFSRGVLPVEMILRMHVPTDSQISFNILMKGGKTVNFLAETNEERIMWTSTLMAAILVFQKTNVQTAVNLGRDMALPYKEGYLKLDGVKQKIYLAIKGDKGAYYKSKNDFLFAQPVTRMKMSVASMRDPGSRKIQLVFPTKVLTFTADSDEEKMSWMESFQMTISGRLSRQKTVDDHAVTPRVSTSLRDHLFKYGGDFKGSTENKKIKNKLNLIKSALQTGEFQKRLCVLECGVLSYCDSEKTSAVKDSFSCTELISITVSTPDIAAKAGFQHCFELSRNSGRTYLFCAEKLETRSRWTNGVLREMLPDHIQEVITPGMEYDKAGRVKIKIEPLTTFDEGWRETWCFLTQSKLLFYDESLKVMESLDLRRLTEINVNKSQEFYDPGSLQQKDATYSIILSFKERFYFIQSETKSDTDSWMNAIRRADNDCGPNLEDMQLTVNGIPIIVEKCTTYVERQGMETRGIYRLSGTHSKTTQLLNSFRHNARETSMIENINVHDVSNALKRWCKSLPGSMLTSLLYDRWIEVAGLNPSQPNEKLERYAGLLRHLPERNRKTLKVILQHLVKVSVYEGVNDMTLHNLAIVFGPTLMGSDGTDGSKQTSVGDTAKQICCIEDLLVNFETLFEHADSASQEAQDEDVYQNIEDIYDVPSMSENHFL